MQTSQTTTLAPVPSPQLPVPAPEHALHHIPVTAILPSRWQPRSTWDPEPLLELAKHIRDHGLMYPVILFPAEDDLPSDVPVRLPPVIPPLSLQGEGPGVRGEGYELVAGERRTRAIVALALADIPAWSAAHDRSLHTAIEYVAAHGWLLLQQDPAIWEALASTTILARLEDPADLPRLHQLAVADNIQRQNLTALEEAKAIADLMAANHLTQRAVADQLGWSQTKVFERLALLKLAPEVRKDLIAQTISPKTARSIAQLPADAQPAFAKVAGEMIQRQGDQAATVGQVAALAGAVRRFLEPDHWLPAPDAILLPVVRNRLRLVRHLLTRLHTSGKLFKRAPAIMALRESGSYSHENLLGRKPDTICHNRSEVNVLLQAIVGSDTDFNHVWDAAAVENVWRCVTCQLNIDSPPTDLDVYLPCPRWKPDQVKTAVNTCDGWSSRAEPLVISADAGMAAWSYKLAPDGFHSAPFPYFDDLDLWIAAARSATEHIRAQDRERHNERDTRHLRELQTYISQQLEFLALPGRFAGLQHFQAHLCPRCIHHRPDHKDIPPCHFAVEPLDDYGHPRAPDFGLLVRQDGLMVPRCSRYRLAEEVVLNLSPMSGFRLPDRPAVLAWIRRLAAWNSRNGHHQTLFAGLAWLPYARPKPKDTQDLDGLIRYLNGQWDDLGDERIATLLHTLVSEISAMAGYHNKIDLFNPVTLRTEFWASVPWSVLLGPVNSWHLSDYPKDWPRPWESSPLPPGPVLSPSGLTPSGEAAAKE